jgi:CheY-like chemotaxis protein
MNDLIQRSIGPEWPISMDLPADLPAVRADANQLEMALLNLIVNARDALPSGGAIVVSASHRNADDYLPAGLRAGPYVRLQVSDKGVGMDSETLRRATEPFFTTKGVGKGTGLGLPMVHGMAEQVGGTFEIKSELGKGTCAILWLPVSTTEQEQEIAPSMTSAAKAQPADVARLTILAVDDDALVLLNTAALLEDLGHNVLEASSGAEALDLVQRMRDIDLIITDQAMPNMTGVELITAVEQIRPGLPAIIASGYGEGIERPRPDIILLGKPFNQTDLTEAICKTFRQSAEA